MAAAPVFVGTPKVGLGQILNATGTANVTILTGGASGSKIVSLVVTSDDTSSRIVKVHITRGGTSYVLTAVTVPIASGTDGSAASVNLLNSASLPGLPVDNDGQRYLLLTDASDTLTANCTTTVTAAKILNIVATYGNF